MLPIPARLRAFLAALALLGAVAPLDAAASSAAATGAGGTAHRAVIQVRAAILPFLRMTILAARSALDLTTEDTRRREVMVYDATQVEVICNTGGYDLRFDLLDPEVLAVEVEGLPFPVRVTAEGITVHVSATSPESRRARRTLSYKVSYRNGVKAGPRPMPLALSLVHP